MFVETYEVFIQSFEMFVQTFEMFLQTFTMFVETLYNVYKIILNVFTKIWNVCTNIYNVFINIQNICRKICNIYTNIWNVFTNIYNDYTNIYSKIPIPIYHSIHNTDKYWLIDININNTDSLYIPTETARKILIWCYKANTTKYRTTKNLLTNIFTNFSLYYNKNKRIKST